MRKVLMLAVIPVILLALSMGTEWLTLASWNAFVQYQSPFTAPLPYGPATPRVSNQVVIVVADGLRLDTSRSMVALNRLRARGADFMSMTGEPSLSLPGWTVIATGAYQEISGVTTNWYTGTVKIDSIFQEAKRQGLSTALVGGGSWQQLFGAYLDSVVPVDEPPEYGDVAAVKRADSDVFGRALSLLHDKQPNLLLIHLHGPDYAGHSFGGASPQYRDVAQYTDGLLAALLQEIDLGQTTLLFTSDHGQIDSGGHGGWEPEVKQTPLVIAGKGVKGTGGTKLVGQADIAPTVAVLLGIPVPYDSQGRALLEALDSPAVLKGEQGLAVGRQLAIFYDAYATTVGVKPFAQSRLAAAQTAIATGDATALADFQDQVRSEASAARADRLSNERLLRVPFSLILLAVPAAYLWRSRPKRALLVPLLGTAFYFAVYNLLFFGRGYRWSLSVFNRDEEMLAFFEERGLDAIIALVVAVIVVGVVSRRRPAFETAQAVVNTSFLTAYLLVLQVLIFFTLYDVRFPWYLPDLALGFKFYLDLLQLVSTGWPTTYLPLAAVLPLLGIVVKWIANRALATQRRVAKEETTPMPAGETD